MSAEDAAESAPAVIDRRYKLNLYDLFERVAMGLPVE